MNVVNRLHHWLCVCGEPATARVQVTWSTGPRVYRYCDDCAHDIVYAVEGAEMLP